MRILDQSDGYGRRLPTRGRQEQFWRRALHTRRLELIDEISTVLRAYVNHGRWVADCPACNGGVLGPNPQDGGTAPCLDCGHLYTIAYPQEWRAIQALLVRRPRMENRNWRPGETCALLRAENLEHGVA